jgi:diguanylate cyclase (GGDEF)-like protein
MPIFAGERELWMLTRKADGWEAALHDATASSPRSADALQAMAATALGRPANEATEGNGIAVGDDLCFPMLVGEAAVGVVGVRNGAAVSASERNALNAAAALLAIAIRNSQLLTQTRESSIRDSLTGCFNRAYALEALNAELHRARRSQRPVSVIMFDVDAFKATNDRFGHLAGDAMLAAIGAKLTTILRATDVKCRYGGDEFLIVLPDTPLAGAERAAATVNEQIARLLVATPDGQLSPTVSLGVTSALEGELDATTLIARADVALYQAKREGRNRYVTSSLAVSA